MMLLAFMLFSTTALGRSPFNLKSNRSANCNLFAEEPNYAITFREGLPWAYAGVRPDPDYFCYHQADWFGTYYTDIIYKPLSAQRNTSLDAVTLNGCSFALGQCTDPTLRQQIIDSNFCNTNAPVQQMADRLLLMLNRSNWLFLIVVPNRTLPAITDDNFCMFNMPNWAVIIGRAVDRCKYHGIGRQSVEEIVHLLKTDLKALSMLFGEQEFVMGSRPTSVDAAAFGHLACGFLRHSKQKDVMESQRFFREECKNLFAYLKRMIAEYYPDWKQLAPKGIDV